MLAAFRQHYCNISTFAAYRCDTAITPLTAPRAASAHRQRAEQHRSAASQRSIAEQHRAAPKSSIAQHSIT